MANQQLHGVFPSLYSACRHLYWVLERSSFRTALDGC